ncbi:uncharacterized protein [Watersipora subatra]|uniref:uncharacterized protein n=1 Tax=Watersipora subatra TaxID=2589382 RepID=UPI00355C4004
MGLELGKRELKHEVDTTGADIGYRAIQVRLQLSYGITVSREVVRQQLLEGDPQGVELQRRGTLRRRVYVNKGPNYLIHVDGYDKLKRYGLRIHGAIDGYSKKLLWLYVGHSNNDPKYVAYNFTQYINCIKGVLRCIRMDRGTENTLIEDIQATIRECHTDDMARNSVLYGSSTHNQPIERWWRSARQLGLQYYLNYFKDLEIAGNFETGNHKDVMCLRYCFMHIVKQKLHEIMMEWNQHTRRSTGDSLGGIPNVLYGHPELQGDSPNFLVSYIVDHKTMVEQQDIDDVITLCMRPKQRGVDEADRKDLNNLVQDLNGQFIIPCSIEAAKDLYIQLRLLL